MIILGLLDKLFKPDDDRNMLNVGETDNREEDNNILEENTVTLEESVENDTTQEESDTEGVDKNNTEAEFNSQCGECGNLFSSETETETHAENMYKNAESLLSSDSNSDCNEKTVHGIS